MTDQAVRDRLAARAGELRHKAEAFRSRCGDDGAKSLITRMVIHPIDDVEQLFLGESSKNLNPKFAGLWWSGAEQTIRMGEDAFVSLEKQFAQFGGPEKVQVIGG